MHGGEPDSRIPAAYYVCAPRIPLANDNPEDTISYPRDQLQRAIDRGLELMYEGTNGEPVAVVHGQTNRNGNARSYPARFRTVGPNAVYWVIPNGVLVNANSLYEFPIIATRLGDYVPFTEGAAQGPDRVVFDGITGAFAGVFTHRGEQNNQFHQAIPLNHDFNAHTTAITFGPTTLNREPFGWFGDGGGSLPLRHAWVYRPADFTLTYTGCPVDEGRCYCYDSITVAGYYPREAAVFAIEHACEDWSGQTVPTPSSLTDIKTLSSTKKVSFDDTDWTITMQVWQTLLAGVSATTVDKNTCIKALTSAMDDCQTGTARKKTGGQYKIDVPSHGSQQYAIHAGDGNPDPGTIPSRR
ncbi:hypothetical protein LTR95_004057 [Oleoguttula sp. CCFEE 5521]